MCDWSADPSAAASPAQPARLPAAARPSAEWNRASRQYILGDTPIRDVALLTFNLLSHGRNPAGDPIVVRWNSTEVYARSNGKWSIIHSHWSFIKPLPMAPPG